MRLTIDGSKKWNKTDINILLVALVDGRYSDLPKQNARS